MTPAEGIIEILLAGGVLGGTTGWVDRVGDAGNAGNIAAFYDSGGRGGEVKVAIDYPTVQVITIGASAGGGYSAAFNKAKEIYNFLQGIETPNAAWPNLVSCVMMNEPLWLGKDESDRPRFSVNMRLIVTPENEGNRTY